MGPIDRGVHRDLPVDQPDRIGSMLRAECRVVAEAARLRQVTERKLGRATPAWVNDLAAYEPEDRPFTVDDVPKHERRLKAEAARLRQVTDRKLGRTTPAWVNDLAAYQPDHTGPD